MTERREISIIVSCEDSVNLTRLKDLNWINERNRLKVVIIWLLDASSIDFVCRLLKVNVMKEGIVIFITLWFLVVSPLFRWFNLIWRIIFLQIFLIIIGIIISNISIFLLIC